MNKDDKKYYKKYYSIYHSRDQLEKEALYRQVFSGFAEKIFEETQNSGQKLGDCFDKMQIINPIKEIKKQWRTLITPITIANQLIPIKYSNNTLIIFCKIRFQIDIIRQQYQETILQNIQKNFPQIHELQLTSKKTNITYIRRLDIKKKILT